MLSQLQHDRDHTSAGYSMVLANTLLTIMTHGLAAVGMQAMADKLYCFCGVLYLMSIRDVMMLCCRHAVQHRLSAAASNQSSGGTILHEYPDFILPFVVQALAHHPDFPTLEVCITASYCLCN